MNLWNSSKTLYCNFFADPMDALDQSKPPFLMAKKKINPPFLMVKNTMYCLVYFKSWKKPPALPRANINLVLHLMSEQFRRAASTPCNGTFLMLKSPIFLWPTSPWLAHIGTKTKVMTVQVADGTSETLVSNRRPMYPPIYLSIWYAYIRIYIYMCVSYPILSYPILYYPILPSLILSYPTSYMIWILSILIFCIYVSMYLCIYVSMYLRNSGYLCI